MGVPRTKKAGSSGERCLVGTCKGHKWTMQREDSWTKDTAKANPQQMQKGTVLSLCLVYVLSKDGFGTGVHDKGPKA